MRWDSDTLTVSPVLCYRIGMAFGGAGGEFWPVWNIHRARRQVNLIGWPLDPWYHDGVVGCAATKAAARMQAERMAAKEERRGND